MKRFVAVRSLILVFALMLGIIPVSATERPFASDGNGIATFITDGAGNVVGATVTLSGNGTHLGLFTGAGTIQFLPDANDPNISHPAGEVTYKAANGDRLPICPVEMKRCREGFFESLRPPQVISRRFEQLINP